MLMSWPVAGRPHINSTLYTIAWLACKKVRGVRRLFGCRYSSDLLAYDEVLLDGGYEGLRWAPVAVMIIASIFAVLAACVEARCGPTIAPCGGALFRTELPGQRDLDAQDAPVELQHADVFCRLWAATLGSRRFVCWPITVFDDSNSICVHFLELQIHHLRRQLLDHLAKEDFGAKSVTCAKTRP